jgi:predicted Zn finger-like uncharacterized protein
MNKTKIRCPKCMTVYTISDDQISILGRKAAKCIICDLRFYIEHKETLGSMEKDKSGITFLQSYFEKRSQTDRRRAFDRRREIKIEGLPSINFSHDIIPLFNGDGSGIVGHISPGRRQGADRRCGSDRRQASTGQNS